jgi:hypothetical protein
MLKGFNYPLTAKGKSTLNPSPPWYYTSDFLSIEFWADLGAVKASLPDGLDEDIAAEGRAQAFFYDWQFTGANDEYLEPARYQYREFFILLDALLKGAPVSYCAYIFVDNDAALARGWTQGFPKRLGQIFQTRLHAAPSKAGPRLAPGGKFAGSLAAAGQRIAEGLVTLREPLTMTGPQRPVVNLLHFPRLSAAKRGTPSVHELVVNVPRESRVEQAWVGDGKLVLPACHGEEISDLAPLRCGRGMRASMSYLVDDLMTVD